MTRPIPEIDRDIAALDEQRRTLLNEREIAVHERQLLILRLFDDELWTFNAIARRVGLSNKTVKQFLFDRGRTVAGRAAKRAQLASLRIEIDPAGFPPR